MIESIINSNKKTDYNQGLCLFCKKKVGSDSGKEHIIPESLGNKNYYLEPGIVCKSCNHNLGNLDNYFIHHNPYVFDKMSQNYRTKKGNLPSNLFKDAEMRKIGDSNFHFSKYKKAKKEDESFIVNKNHTAEYKAKFHMEINPELISRFLAKVGIETLYFEKKELAYNERFDEIRNYAIKGRPVKFVRYGQKKCNTGLISTRLIILPSHRVNFRTFFASESLRA